MEFTYTVSLDDYREYSRMACTKTTWKRKLNYWSLLVFCPVSGGIIVISSALLIGSGHKDRILNAAFAVFGLFLLWRPFAYRRSVSKLYRQNKCDTPYLCSVTDEGVDIQRRDGTLQSKIAWGALDKYLDSEKYLMLYLSPISILPIPKRALNAEQLETFSGLLTTHVPAK